MLEEFFAEIDAEWKRVGEEPLPLKIIGSTALFLQSSYSRGTKDSDILELQELSEPVTKELIRIAGKKSRISRRHHIYLDIVAPVIPFLPRVPLFHDLNDMNARLKNFRLSVLDVTDVVVSKLKRFSADDVEDIKNMVELNLVGPKNLVRRFESAIDRWSMDARADDFHQYVDNLHTVERDFLLVEESKIELPRWLEE